MQNFGTGIPGFRIGAPFAAQGAAFEKNRASNPFTIVYGPALNLKYIPLTGFHMSFFQ
jgi:hypothetical protein